MSIASAIANAKTKVAAAYTACNNKGATMPSQANQDLDHLANTIGTISGGGGGSNLISLSVTPSTSAQQITPTSPVDGYNEVNVAAVTNAIDANITPGNIKDGVTILGVLGTLTAAGLQLSGYSTGKVWHYQVSASANKPTIHIPNELGVVPKLIIGVLTGDITGRTQCIGPFFVQIQQATGQNNYGTSYTSMTNGTLNGVNYNISVTVNNDNSVDLYFPYGYLNPNFGHDIILLA